MSDIMIQSSPRWQLEELKLTPEQQAISFYEFLVADLKEGFNYIVKQDIANAQLEKIKASFRFTEDTDSTTFCKTFYTEYKKSMTLE